MNGDGRTRGRRGDEVKGSERERGKHVCFVLFVLLLYYNNFGIDLISFFNIFSLYLPGTGNDLNLLSPLWCSS